VEGLRIGAEEAFEELIARYQIPVYNLAFRLLDDPADTKDVVQEVFLKVFRNVSSFRGHSSLKTWIHRITVNEAYNYRRWFHRHRRRELPLDGKGGAEERTLGETLADRSDSPYDVLLGAETRSLMEEELARLKPVFRQAVVLRDVENLSYEEIAEILDVSLGTVKSRIVRGREALRRSLGERLRQANPVGWPAQPAEQD
jgi:RNA polymerase sigma-70 factor (ECF subfamily)